jgi:hypothetical protein
MLIRDLQDFLDRQEQEINRRRRAGNLRSVASWADSFVVTSPNGLEPKSFGVWLGQAQIYLYSRMSSPFNAPITPLDSKRAQRDLPAVRTKKCGPLAKDVCFFSESFMHYGIIDATRQATGALINA